MAILGYIDHETGKWTKGPPPPETPRGEGVISREERGFLLQMPPGWTDGKPGINYVRSGPGKGRVCFTSRREAREIAARYEGLSGERTRYAPD